MSNEKRGLDKFYSPRQRPSAQVRQGDKAGPLSWIVQSRNKNVIFETHYDRAVTLHVSIRNKFTLARSH
jgi:hypothetical protein